MSENGTGSGKNNLPQIVSSGPETACARKQIIGPHSEKAIAVFVLQQVPIVGKISVPGHQGLVVVLPEVMPILHDEFLFYAAADLLGGRKHGIGKNIAVYPGINIDYGEIAANGMQQKESVVFYHNLND